MLDPAYADAVAAAACEAFRVHPRSFRDGILRAPPLSDARACAMLILHDAGGGWSEIAHLLGGYNHSSVIAAVRRGRKKCTQNAVFCALHARVLARAKEKCP